MEIQEAVGTLLDVTESADSTVLTVRLKLGEIELQFTQNRPNKLRDELQRHIGRKIGLLSFYEASGDHIVKIRELKENERDDEVGEK